MMNCRPKYFLDELHTILGYFFSAQNIFINVRLHEFQIFAGHVGEEVRARLTVEAALSTGALYITGRMNVISVQREATLSQLQLLAALPSHQLQVITHSIRGNTGLLYMWGGGGVVLYEGSSFLSEVLTQLVECNNYKQENQHFSL